jgi:type IV fimbrial biogenesis protein FimT
MRTRTHSSSSWSGKRRLGGFTLMELMVVLAIAAVIMGLAVPNFRAFIRNSRLTSGANDLLSSISLARTEAIKRQLPVAVCATADPNANVPVCSGAWSQGASSAWVVWVDADNDWVPDNNPNEPVLQRHAALDSTITVRSDNNGRIKYQLTGFASPPSGGITPTANIAMCDVRGTAATVGGVSAGRAVRISATGRPRVSKTTAEVDATLAAIGSACP